MGVTAMSVWIAHSAGAAKGNQPPLPAITLTCESDEDADRGSDSGEHRSAECRCPGGGGGEDDGEDGEAELPGHRRYDVGGDASESADETEDDEGEQESGGRDEAPREVDEEFRGSDRGPGDRYREQAGDRAVGELTTEQPAEYDAVPDESGCAGDLDGDGDVAGPSAGVDERPELGGHLGIVGVDGEQHRRTDEGDPEHHKDRGGSDHRRMDEFGELGDEADRHAATSSLCTRSKKARSMSTPCGSRDPMTRPAFRTEMRPAIRATSSR